MSFLKKLRKKIRIRKHYNFQFFRHTSILNQVKRKVSLKGTKISKKYLSRLLKEYLLREKNIVIIKIVTVFGILYLKVTKKIYILHFMVKINKI